MSDVTFRSCWTTGGTAYVLLVMALAIAAAVNGDGSGPYLAAVVMTFPSCVILYPILYPVVVLVAMAAGVGIDGSGPSWVGVPLYAWAFGAAAVANVFLLWLVSRAVVQVPVRVRLARAKH